MLHALMQRRAGEWLLVVLIYEYVFRGITKWSAKWRHHDWRTASGEVGHRDLWEQILREWERAGEQVQLRWNPSPSGVSGNHGADALAEQGRGQHPNNFRAIPKRHRQQQWENLGLEEMESVEERSESYVDSGMQSSSHDMLLDSGDSAGRGGSPEAESEEFSTDVGESRFWRHASLSFSGSLELNRDVSAV